MRKKNSIINMIVGLVGQVIDEHLLDSVLLLGFRDNPYPYVAADFHCHGSQNTRCR